MRAALDPSRALDVGDSPGRGFFPDLPWRSGRAPSFPAASVDAVHVNRGMAIARRFVKEQSMTTQVQTLTWGTWTLIFVLVLLILSIVYLAY